MRRTACVVGAVLVGGVLAGGRVEAAPAITRVINGGTPAVGHVGAPLLLLANELAPPVQVFFSDGANPTVEAIPTFVDAARGVVLVPVPAGAATGNMRLRAGGVDSAPYFLRVAPGPVVPGPNTVSGRVTDGTEPVAGAIVFAAPLDGNCNRDGGGLVLTDANGDYTISGGDGGHFVLVVPPSSSGLAAAGEPVTLSATPATRDFVLGGGTLVTGRVVDAADPSTPLAGARIDFDYDAGPTHELALADANGEFSVRLLPGDWSYDVTPPPGGGHAAASFAATIGGGAQDLGDIPLSGGVRIDGTLTAAADGSPLPNVWVHAVIVEPCCTYADELPTAGDGSFTLVVPGNQTYRVSARFEDGSTFADAGLSAIDVGTANVAVELSAVEAALITGIVTELASGAPIACLRVGASNPADSGPGPEARTASDGSYVLRVPPDPAGYQVGTRGRENGEPEYAVKMWNGAPDGTYFSCEATPVPAATAGETIPGIDFAVPLAAAVEGRVSSAAAACADDLGNGTAFNITVDDGTAHGCSMGNPDWMHAPGYRVGWLPPSSAVASGGLRACARIQGYDPQCWNLELAPAFDPIVVAAGATTTGIDFCLESCASPSGWYGDADGDGHGDPGAFESSCTPPVGYVQTPDDCDDGDPSVHGGATETCNGTDDDCNDLVDDGNPGGGAPCLTGLPGVCEAGTMTCQAGELVCAPDTPASPETCNDLDDDCDGTVDGFTTTCGIGACGRTGTCTTGSDSCVPGEPAGDDATCDGVDDDCDGSTDEDFVSAPTACGAGICAATGDTSCVSGQVEDSCTPGVAAPDDATCDGADDDCDGTADEDFVAAPTSCGIGACAASGATSCQDGELADSCTPGVPAASDGTCDGIDDDCDGAADEEFVAVPTACGVGACASTGVTSCTAGLPGDSCTPGAAQAETCNGIDDDCDGATDEVSGGCSLAITDPTASTVLDCRPTAAPPTITWDHAGYDRYRVELAADATFKRKVKSGRRLLDAPAWVVPARAWKKACARSSANLHLRVLGVDVDLPKRDPARKAYSGVLAVPTQR